MRRPEPSEKQIQAAVMAHWRACGVEGTFVGAIPNARAFGQPGLTKGLFDLLVISPGQVRFLELKTLRGEMSAAQEDFRLILIRNGIEHAVTYGRDQPIYVLETWGVCRPPREGTCSASITGSAGYSRHPTWTARQLYCCWRSFHLRLSVWWRSLETRFRPS